MAKSIQRNSHVTMHLRTSLANGFVVDDTYGEEPFQFVMGDGALLPALENALMGLKESQKKQIELQPSEAFGHKSSENVYTLKRNEFPNDMVIEVGYIIEFTTPSGEVLPGTIVQIENEDVTVDFNHPLADQIVHFDVEIVAVN